jgi:mannose-6-phosphate isomerase-like protein (cupin superfamily)
MLNINRRTLLYAFGVVSVSPLLRAQTASSRRAAVAKPGENRFAFASEQQAQRTACKLTSDDSAGACSIFELGVPPRSGPPLHVHHREDEWYYVLSGEFLFEVDGEQSHLPAGGSIWAPRDARHRWANTSTGEGKLILMCQPGGFEKFFDELGKAPLLNTQNPSEMHQLHELHAKYGMELLGPPIFPSTPPAQSNSR